MQARPSDIPLTFEGEPGSTRNDEWGTMNVGYERLAAGTDTRPLFVGLPDNRCQCPHWGYLLKGRVRVFYADREEVIRAGEAYYMPPGHTTLVEEDCEQLHFSPQGEYRKTLAVIERNLAAASNGS
ncbi:MAG TPA: hypothetical protein PKA20_04590 [Burkholderiaceae bacterium]|nr:hypothetical protein [Burkholderiaceae bacterium]